MFTIISAERIRILIIVEKYTDKPDEVFQPREAKQKWKQQKPKIQNIKTHKSTNQLNKKLER